MLRSINSLQLSDSIVSQLKDNGFYYVEDIQNVSASTTTCPDAIEKAQKMCKLPATVSALSIIKEEFQRFKISTLSQRLDDLLDGGFHCKTVTELNGAPGSGKTEICLQISISAQFSRTRNQSGGKTLFIDIEGGLSALRLEEMVKGSQAYFEAQDFDVNKILDQVIVASPQTFDELAAVINNFEQLAEYSQIRLIIVDSIAYLRHSIEHSFQRTHVTVNILSLLHKLSTRHNLAVVVTNELHTQVTGIGRIQLAPAGGTFCAHMVHKRIMLRRLNDYQFEACLIKSLTLPKVASKFRVTADGIRDTIV